MYKPVKLETMKKHLDAADQECKRLWAIVGTQGAGTADVKRYDRAVAKWKQIHDQYEEQAWMER